MISEVKCNAVEKKFLELYSEKPLLFRSPGRVNIIGEHTDYNMGFVLPGAIDKAIYYAISPRTDDVISLFSVDLVQECVLELTNIQHQKSGWPNYLLGVVDQLIKAGYMLKGFNCVFGGDIPIGAGLSSSAAIEGGLAFALDHLFNLKINKFDLVKMAQKAENEFVGVNCGIMDQFINIFGESNKVLKIDCRSLEIKYVPFEFDDISIILFDTCVSHSLASSEYNQRRRDCTAGVELIRKENPLITSLRDVSIGMLNEYKKKLEPKIFNRCKYVVEENDRLLSACEALNKNDLKTLGALMFQTHEGLSKEYKVSCTELDFLVDLVRENPAVYGSRMMGGGFGGCTINLVENSQIEKISAEISVAYKNKFGKEMKNYITTISSGTQLITR
jgi:galactokinase